MKKKIAEGIYTDEKKRAFFFNPAQMNDFLNIPDNEENRETARNIARQAARTIFNDENFSNIEEFSTEAPE